MSLAVGGGVSAAEALGLLSQRRKFGYFPRFQLDPQEQSISLNDEQLFLFPHGTVFSHILSFKSGKGSILFGFFFWLKALDQSSDWSP